MSEEKRSGPGAPPEDETSALFVTARKKQLAEQEAARKAAEDGARRKAAEEEVRRMEAEVARRKREAEDETRRLTEEQAAQRKDAEEKAKQLAAEQEARQKAAQRAEKAGQKQEKAQAARPRKKSLGLKIGLGILAALVLLFILVLVLGGNDDQTAEKQASDGAYNYQLWSEALNLTDQKYMALSGKDRRSMISAMDQVLGGDTLQFDQADAALTDSSQDSGDANAFTVVCSDAGIDSEGYLQGFDGTDNVYDWIVMPGKNFLILGFDQQMAAVSALATVLTENQEMITADYDSGTAFTCALLEALSTASPDEMSTDGSLFRAVCNLVGLDGESLYPEYESLYAPQGGAGEEPDDLVDDAPDGYHTFYDSASGLKIYYADGMTVSSDGTNGGEVVTLSNGLGCMLIYDITEMYSGYDGTDDELLQNLIGTVCTSYVPQLYGSYQGIVDGSINNQGADLSGDGSIALARISCRIVTSSGTLYAFGEITRVDKTDLTTFSMVLRSPSDETSMEQFNEVYGSMSYVAG